MTKFRLQLIYAISNGRHESNLEASMAKHLPNHKTGRGLAIGASNADNSEVFGWMVIFCTCDNRLSEMIGKNGLIVKWEFFEGLFHDYL